MYKIKDKSGTIYSMKVIGIIAEFNPFHKGHEYIIKQAKETYGADYVVVLMSGNFTQRGSAAIFNKYLRTQIALSCGADLVLELPVYYATGSAAYFANGAVSILQGLGIVTHLLFGCETEDLDMIQRAAKVLAKEPRQFQEALKKTLKKGNSYPKARMAGLQACGIQGASLEDPNTILALEYCLALEQQNSKIQPIAIKRQGLGYHDVSLSEEAFASASGIRKVFMEETREGSLEGLQSYLPEDSLSWYENHPYLPLDGDSFSQMLRYKLLSCPNGLTAYGDVSEDLQDKIQKNLNHFLSIEQFCDLLKSKDITHTRLRRSLLHILLDLTQEAYEGCKAQNYPGYARILGFRSQAGELMHGLKEQSDIPILSRPAEGKFFTNPLLQTLFEKDVFAANLYQGMVQAKSNVSPIPYQNELQQKVIVY